MCALKLQLQQNTAATNNFDQNASYCTLLCACGLWKSTISAATAMWQLCFMCGCSSSSSMGYAQFVIQR